MTADPAITLAAHRLARNDGELTARCTCEWESEPVTTRSGKCVAHEAHQLSMLSATHAITGLPEHRVIEVWAERRDEISWRCLCGLVHKHIPLPAHVNTGTALVCANQPKGQL